MQPGSHKNNTQKIKKALTGTPGATSGTGLPGNTAGCRPHSPGGSAGVHTSPESYPATRDPVDRHCSECHKPYRARGRSCSGNLCPTCYSIMYDDDDDDD